MQDNITRKIGKLLALSERAAFPAEADAFLARAQALATQYQVSLELARTSHAMSGRRPQPIVRQIKLGEKRKMGLATYVELFDAIGVSNNVKILIAKDSTYVVAHGFDDDIDLVEQLYSSLVTQMVAASNDYIRKGDYKSELVWQEKRVKDPWGRGYYTDTVFAPISRRTARISFQDAFAGRIRERLREAARQARQAAAPVVTEQGESTSAELVLVGRRDAVAKFYATKTSHIKGSWKGGRRNRHSDHGTNAGYRAGSEARIGASTAIGGQRAAISA